jgi:poly[(R)-3-hydroxyalkanoate] polymerase subunit PhaC
MGPRPGPRPLALHLMAAAAIAIGSRSGWPIWSAASSGWNPALAPEAQRLAQALASANREALAAALDREARRRLGEFLTGIETYRTHPYARALADPPVLWEEGATRLLDYGADSDRPVLVIPSLVNRAYVLDLDTESSFVRHLAGRGLRPLLVDWGAPGATERGFGLTDYVAGRLARALDAARDAAGGPVALVGYCMGGLLALGLAQLRRADVSGLALLATPWDFHAATGEPHPVLAAMGRALGTLIDTLGELPVDTIQALFFALDPVQGWSKFRAFGRLDPSAEAARRFVALEDWANDGVPLAGPAARECLFDWYGENAPARGAWRVAGAAIRPERLDLPSLHLIPARDRIVPPESARALAAAMAGAKVLSPEAGHVGMAVGRSARSAVWQPVADWLNGL